MDKMINMYHLRQVITRPTRVTANSESLIDHICVSDVNNAIEHCVPASACSDHYPVCLTWSRKGPKYLQLGTKRPLIVALLTLMKITLFVT